MFSGTPISSFSAKLNKLDDAYGMFKDCPNLSSFTSDASLARNISYMFYNCYNLEEIHSDFSTATNATYAFYNTPIKEFDCNLSSLTSGDDMFRNCKSLVNFISFVPEISRASYMF
jgi:hypothetical protein